MVEPRDTSIEKRIQRAYVQLNELRANEAKSHVLILSKDKEIARLKDELSEVEQQIKVNRAAYTKNSLHTAVLHPLINYEFELLKEEIFRVNEGISSLAMENFFKKQSESGGSGVLGDLVSHLESQKAGIKSDISSSGVEKLENDLSKKADQIYDLEGRVKDTRELVFHLRSEVDRMQSSVAAFQTKISQLEKQNEKVKPTKAKKSK